MGSALKSRGVFARNVNLFRRHHESLPEEIKPALAPPPLPAPKPAPIASRPIALSSSQQALLTEALGRKGVRVLRDLSVDNPASKIGLVVGGTGKSLAPARSLASDEANRGPII